MDDCVNLDPDEREQAIVELMKEKYGIHVSEDPADAPEGSLMVYEVNHEVSKFGRAGGDALYELLSQKIPVDKRGNLIILFSGYMGTSRELFEIPNIREFMRGYFFGMEKFDKERAKIAVSILFNEDRFGAVGLDASGQLWALANCFAGFVYFKDGDSWMRNIDNNRMIRSYILSPDSEDQKLMNLIFELPLLRSE